MGEGLGPDYDEFDESVHLNWADIENAFALAYLRGDQSDQFLDVDGDTETLRLYLRYKTFNLMLGRPLFPERAGPILFWIQITAPADREDIPRELYAALNEDDRLFVIRGDTLENIGRPRTDEILRMIRDGVLIPKVEFTEETG